MALQAGFLMPVMLYELKPFQKDTGELTLQLENGSRTLCNFTRQQCKKCFHLPKQKRGAASCKERLDSCGKDRKLCNLTNQIF